jgi:hypothetical protein
MTPFEAKLSALLVECEKQLKPTLMISYKWVIIGGTQKKLQPVLDKKSSLAYAYIRSHNNITSLKSYFEAKDAFGRDNVFSTASRIAGYWGTFEALVQYLIVNSGNIKKKSISINQPEALRILREYRDTLTSRHIEFIGIARLFGVNLRCKLMALPDGTTLYRLNRKERNDRQPLIQQTFLSHTFEEELLGDHPAELRVPITIPIDCSQDGALFKAKNDALKVAFDIFNKIHQSILIVSNGTARLGSVELQGGLEQLPIGKSIIRDFPPHTNILLSTADVEKIRVAYDLLSGGKTSDKTFSRALHRYILGRQRPNLVDKLVDYVIAWEAILLTQDGNPINQELSYRFALNGASLIHIVRKDIAPNEIYKKMRSAYSTRSSIVHGSADKDVEKELRIGDFSNLSELCNFLEDSFRLIIFHLSSVKAKDRPYRQSGGWESLLWPNK